MASKHSASKPMFGFGTPKAVEDQSEMRKHFIAASGEFVGTFLFLFFAFLGHSMSVQQAADQGPGGTNSSTTIIYISMSYGLSLLVTAWTLYRVSGGLFNPAVTLGLMLTGNLPMVRGLILIPVQFLSGIVAAAVASGIIPGDISVVQTTLAPDMSVVRGLFLEMFLTSQLIFTILMLAAEKSKATFIAPIGIGLALFVVEIAGVYYTGASVNPARSFGPCVAGANFQGYHWIYWLGPVLGAVIAAGYYHMVKFLNYEDANPGQDSADGAFDPNVEELEKQGSRSSPTQSRQMDYDQSRQSQSRQRNSRDYNQSRPSDYNQQRQSDYNQPRHTDYGHSPQEGYTTARQVNEGQNGHSRDGQAPYIPADVVQGMSGRM